MLNEFLRRVARFLLNRLPPGLADPMRVRFRSSLAMVRGRFAAPPSSDAPSPEFEAALPVAIERHRLALADLDGEAIRSLVASLNDKAERVGCVVFEGREEAEAIVVVVFAGNIERFYMLPVARHLSCRVVYFQDLQSGWYQGSSVLPEIGDLCRTVLRTEIGGRPCIFFGQSSGGYAALAAAAFFPKATVIACAPQTFSDVDVKSRIGFVGIRCLTTPAGLLDLQLALNQETDSDALRAIVIAASENENPYSAHYWMDYLHALRLVDLPAVRVTIVNANSHVIVHGRLNLFADLLQQLQAIADAARPRKQEVIDAFLARVFQP